MSSTVGDESPRRDDKPLLNALPKLGRPHLLFVALLGLVTACGEVMIGVVAGLVIDFPVGLVDEVGPLDPAGVGKTTLEPVLERRAVTGG